LTNQILFNIKSGFYKKVLAVKGQLKIIRYQAQEHVFDEKNNFDETITQGSFNNYVDKRGVRVSRKSTKGVKVHIVG
jgi:hypothetical protein